MPRRYRPAEVIRVLESFGWAERPGKGSHVRMIKPGNPMNLAIPTSTREMAQGTFRQTLRKAGISNRRFEDRANEIL